ncbi:MAG TPA: phytoene/squalene synthase family protein [Euzebya sp.]|nr:phytoene/squalene synthase family protein [Euzebya sp.]
MSGPLLTSPPRRSSAVAGGYVHPTPAHDIAVRLLGSRLPAAVDLAASYALCRRINALHGRTYYFATRLLPADKRPHVHALYAFARYADDLVDHMGLGWTPDRRREELERWSEGFLADLEAGHTEDPVCKAVIHTVTTLGIDHDDLRAFLASMSMDLTVTRYGTYTDLYTYMHGSAAVIGTMMLPILEPRSLEARRPAMDLGVAFQLTNFIRDVAEDFERGRIYLPQEDLERFGVSEVDFRSRHVSPAMRRLLAFEIARARALYRRAEAGWALLPPASARCIRTAHKLYAGILDAVEDSGYQVFRVRASVPSWRKAMVAAREMHQPPSPSAAATGTA